MRLQLNMKRSARRPLGRNPPCGPIWPAEADFQMSLAQGPFGPHNQERKSEMEKNNGCSY